MTPDKSTADVKYKQTCQGSVCCIMLCDSKYYVIVIMICETCSKQFHPLVAQSLTAWGTMSQVTDAHHCNYVALGHICGM